MSNPFTDTLADTLDHLEATNAGGDPTALSTGFRDLDILTAGGLRPGTLTVVASRPGMGRTTLLSDICRHNAIASKRPTAVWTVEESNTEFTGRIVCAEARVPRDHLRAGNLADDAAWTRIARTMHGIAEAPLYLASPPSLTMATLREGATELVAKHGVRLIAVDGIQDIRPERRNDLREREVGDIARDLKTLARELDVPVLATSHLNRGPEQRSDKRPRLDDLRESGAITFAADVIVLLHREDYYERESPRAGEADLIVAKHRHGQTLTITVAHQAAYGRFVDMTL